MTQSNAILGLLAQTSIHAGAGSSVGAVDLPIQREGHTGLPCIFGSAVKGALRTKADNKFGQNSDIVSAVFGPEKGDEHAGAIAVGDARLLLLPVRSLTSTFKWVTCGEALKRFKRDIDLLNLNVAIPNFESVDVEDNNEGCNAKAYQGDVSLFLEEYRFTITTDTTNLSGIITALATLMQRKDAEEELRKRLVIVSDDIFSYLARSATPVTAHIAINSKGKTTKKGALWYEETLPPETLLYVPLMANNSRNDGKPMDAKTVCEVVTKDLFKNGVWLQVGGNETVGMGWCAVKPVNQEVMEG
ncbi:MAG: type III-B CRISPR module RAMP protein Cmr4 [Candidatus Desantisbacteria bacterium]